MSLVPPAKHTGSQDVRTSCTNSTLGPNGDKLVSHTDSSWDGYRYPGRQLLWGFSSENGSKQKGPLASPSQDACHAGRRCLLGAEWTTSSHGSPTAGNQPVKLLPSGHRILASQHPVALLLPSGRPLCHWESVPGSPTRLTPPPCDYSQQ